jgi:hypothetical protein
MTEAIRSASAVVEVVSMAPIAYQVSNISRP